MCQDAEIAASRFMSLVLRHDPGSIGLVLDREGWASVADLADRSEGRLTDALIRKIVRESDKRRFALSDDGLRIRANQGHSIDVDLDLAPVAPPEALFHGTATRFLIAIRAEGLLPRGRQFVHLSPDADTAAQVGRRHGAPAVLRVRSGAMHRAGHAFFLSRNGVWLTKAVPAPFLRFDPS